MTRHGHIRIPSELGLGGQMDRIKLMGRPVHGLGLISWILSLLQGTPNAIYKTHKMFVVFGRAVYEVPITDVRIYEKVFRVDVQSEKIRILIIMTATAVGIINPHGSYHVNNMTHLHLHPGEEVSFNFTAQITC